MSSVKNRSLASTAIEQGSSSSSETKKQRVITKTYDLVSRNIDIKMFPAKWGEDMDVIQARKETHVLRMLEDQEYLQKTIRETREQLEAELKLTGSDENIELIDWYLSTYILNQYKEMLFTSNKLEPTDIDRLYEKLQSLGIINENSASNNERSFTCGLIREIANFRNYCDSYAQERHGDYLFFNRAEELLDPDRTEIAKRIHSSKCNAKKPSESFAYWSKKSEYQAMNKQTCPDPINFETLSSMFPSSEEIELEIKTAQKVKIHAMNPEANRELEVKGVLYKVSSSERNCEKNLDLKQFTEMLAGRKAQKTDLIIDQRAENDCSRSIHFAVQNPIFDDTNPEKLDHIKKFNHEKTH